MPQKIKDFPAVPEILPIRADSPYARWVVVEVGVLSILFSYSRPVGLEYLDGVYVLEGTSRATQKHINTWRDYNRQHRISKQKFDSLLFAALSQESLSLKGEHPMQEGQEQGLEQEQDQDPVSREVDELDNLDDEDDLDDLDDDDDDFDDDEDDDDRDDEDDEDDDLTDLDDEYDDQPTRPGRSSDDDDDE